MIVDLIVVGSALFSVVFAVVWLARADVRAWIEAPKHRFQAHVQQYDRSVGHRRT